MNATNSDRMGGISRMAIEYAREMLERDRFAPRVNAAVERIDAVPVRLSLDRMSDREAAREIAAAIYRALAREVGP
jgi:hypothetical protein